MAKPEAEKVDLAKAAERLAEAQDGVKLAHTAYQTCTKAWDGIHGPSDAKRAMWQAVMATRKSLESAMKTEAKHFGIMVAIVGQGDLFNADGPEEEPHDPDNVGPAGPAGPGAGPSTAIARRPRKPRAGTSPAAN